MFRSIRYRIYNWKSWVQALFLLDGKIDSMTQNTSKGGQNPTNTSADRPAPPQGSGDKKASETKQAVLEIRILELIKLVEDQNQRINHNVQAIQNLNKTVVDVLRVLSCH